MMKTFLLNKIIVLTACLLSCATTTLSQGASQAVMPVAKSPEAIEGEKNGKQEGNTIE